MISKLQEFVDNIKKVLEASATSSIAAPSPVETAPPPPRTAIPDVSTVEDNTKIEAGPTRKGAMAAALAMTLQRLNNVQALNEAGKRDVAIRQADREAAAAAHQSDIQKQFENEKNLLNFKENLPSNVDARATNKAYREAMTRNANASADFKQARLSGSLPSMTKGGSLPSMTKGGSGGGNSTKLTDDDLMSMGINVAGFRAADAKSQQQIIRNAAVKKAHSNVAGMLKMAEYYDNTGNPEDAQKASQYRELAGAALLGISQGEAPKQGDAQAKPKAATFDDQMANYLKDPKRAPTQIAPSPQQPNGAIEFVGEDGRTYRIDPTTKRVYIPANIKESEDKTWQNIRLTNTVRP